MINDEETLKYVDGAAIHWYAYGITPLEVMELARSPKKNIFQMNSESSTFSFQ